MKGGTCRGSVLGVWRITPDAIEKMPLDFEVPEPDPSQGSWSCTYFRFTLPDASGLGTSESVSGPLCGYGYHYRVGDDSVEIVKDYGFLELCTEPERCGEPPTSSAIYDYGEFEP